MKIPVKDIWARIPRPVRVIGTPLVIIIIIGLLWFYGARIVNWGSRTIFRGRNAVVTREIQKDTDDARAAKELANKAIQELAQKKQELAQAETELANERQKREAAEAVLADKTKTANQRLAAYEDAVRRAPTVTVNPESVDEQCARAKSLGLDLEICR